MEILGKILGNPARVKIMRLFLLNKGKGFKNKDITKRSRVIPEIVRKEIKLLASVGFIRRKGRASLDWSFNSSFKYAAEFEDLLVGFESFNRQKLLDSFKKIGQLKFLAVSGVFIQNTDSRVDLLIVGDNMKKRKVEDALRKFEAEIGIELVYAIFNTKEFIYRLSMYDKLVRDILDYPHEVLLQGKELSTQVLKKT